MFALGLILSGSLVGRNSFVNWILMSEFMEVCARLCYSVYLVHVFIYLQYYVSVRTALYAQYSYIIWIYFYVLIASFLLAFPFTLLFEVPFMNIEKFLLFPPRSKPEKKEVKVDTEETPSKDLQKTMLTSSGD